VIIDTLHEVVPYQRYRSGLFRSAFWAHRTGTVSAPMGYLPFPVDSPTTANHLGSPYGEDGVFHLSSAAIHYNRARAPAGLLDRL